MTAIARMITGKPALRVIVKADIGSSMTDGESIWVKPTLSMGDDFEHERVLCGQRDPETEAQLCTACDRMDNIATSLYHEIGHIAEGTFVALPDALAKDIVFRTLEERGDGGNPAKRTTKILNTIKAIERTHGELGFMGAATVVSPYLPMLLNALEDSRVNRAMYQARPGLEVMFRSTARRVFRNGIVQPDGTRTFWSEQPLDAQAMIGTYILGAQYSDMIDHLDASVRVALSDPELLALIDKVTASTSIETVYRSAFPILERLRAYGFCKKPDDAEDDPEPEPEPKPSKAALVAAVEDDESESGDQPGGSSGSASKDDGDGDGDGDAGDDDTDEDGDDTEDDEADGDADESEGEDEGDDGTGGDGHEGAAGDGGEAGASGSGLIDAGMPADDDDAAELATITPEELEKLLNEFMGHEKDGRPATEHDTERDEDVLKAAEVQYDVFDSSSSKVRTLHVHREGHPILSPSGMDRSDVLGWSPETLLEQAPYERRLGDTPEGVMSRSVAKARMVFSENRAVGSTRGQKSGRVDARRLSRVGTGDHHVFMRRSAADTRNYFALLGLDISGSTQGSTVALIKQLGGAMSDVFARLGVTFGLYAHTGLWHDFSLSGGYPSPRTDSMVDVDIFELKAPAEPWATQQKGRLARLTSGAFNIDGHTLEFYRKVAEARPEEVRMIFYLTDGSMPAENYNEEKAILIRETAKCRQLGIPLIGLGLGTDSPTEYGMDTIIFDSSSDLPRVISEVEKRLTKL